MKTVNKILIEILKEDKRLICNNNLLKSNIIELTLKNDIKLIELLLKNESLTNIFFKKTKNILIFNQNKFINFISNKEFLPDSYTSFKNKIGLKNDRGYFSESSEVVLAWPYKDCILEGGQEKEEEKRDEVFYNETLAPDEIDRLLEPKVFTNFILYDKNGEHNIFDFKYDSNLIINGNNLLVLHSLKRRFQSKVKLIYIDPPYNIGGDGFNYNDKFNHSTWLTFMKNRLEVARELLSEEGAIFVQIDHHEIFYLGLIMDEMFGRENFVQLISVKVSAPAGFKTVNPGPIDVTEYILFYTKNKQKFNFKKKYVSGEYDENYKYYIKNFEKGVKEWKLIDFKEIIYKKIGVKDWRGVKEKFGNSYKIVLKQMMSDFAKENSEKVVRLCDPHKASGKLKELIEKSKKMKDTIFHHERENFTDFYIMNGGLFAFYSNKLGVVDGELTPKMLLTDFWDDIAWEGIQNEGKVIFKNAKKPEKLLQRIIELATEETDLVMDFFLGSGTTCAVAHKLNRKFIGIEQLDYGENSAVKRLRNVFGRADSKGKLMETIVDYDNSGISRNVNWQGGGNFIYFELMKLNERFIELIHNLQTKDKLLELLDKIKENGFNNYKIDFNKLEDNKNEFMELTLVEQKQILTSILDKNQLYVNMSEIDDEDFSVSENDTKINKKFYNIIELI